MDGSTRGWERRAAWAHDGRLRGATFRPSPPSAETDVAVAAARDAGKRPVGPAPQAQQHAGRWESLNDVHKEARQGFHQKEISPAGFVLRGADGHAGRWEGRETGKPREPRANHEGRWEARACSDRRLTPQERAAQKGAELRGKGDGKVIVGVTPANNLPNGKQVGPTPISWAPWVELPPDWRLGCSRSTVCRPGRSPRRALRVTRAASRTLAYSLAGAVSRGLSPAGSQRSGSAAGSGRSSLPPPAGEVQAVAG